MNLQPLPRHAEPCAIHPRLASIRSVAVLPFSDSDKSNNQNMVRPDGQQVPLYMYPIMADGEYISRQVEEELIRTSPRLKILHGTWGRQQGFQAARMIGHQLGAQAAMVGTVVQYRAITKLSTEGQAWIQASFGEVGFTIDILDTQDGTVLLRCQKAASSLNFLEKPYYIYSTQRISDITQTLNTALHGATAVEITSYVTANLMKELAQTFGSIRWEAYPPAAHIEQTRPSNDTPSTHDSNVTQSSEESKKEVLRTLNSIGLQDVEQLQAGVVKIRGKSQGGASKVGTGFIVRLDKDAAYIVTAAHVVAGDPHPQVEFFTKRNMPLVTEVLGLEGDDEVRGLGLLVVRGQENLPKGLRALPLAETVRFLGGEDIIMIGFPGNAGPWNVVKGNISSRQGRDLYFSPMVDSGHSGGPILQNGKVVGVVAAVGQSSGRGVIARSVRDYAEGFGVMIPDHIVPDSP